MTTKTDQEKIAHLQDTVQQLISYIVHLSSDIRCGDNTEWIERRLEDLARDFRDKI